MKICSLRIFPRGILPPRPRIRFCFRERSGRGCPRTGRAVLREADSGRLALEIVDKVPAAEAEPVEALAEGLAEPEVGPAVVFLEAREDLAAAVAAQGVEAAG
jgi:hypothetical protein